MTDKTNKGLTRAQLSKIWDAIDTKSWEALLRTHRNKHNFVNYGEGAFKGLCINSDHADHDPSCYIYTDKHYLRCYGCGYYLTNPIDVYASITGRTLEESYTQILEDYKVKGLPKKITEELELARINRLVKEAIYRVCHSVLCSAINDPKNPKYVYAQEAVDWLLNVRNIPVDAIPALPVGVLPPLTEIATMLDNDLQARKQGWSTTHIGPEPERITPKAVEYLETAYRGGKFTGAIVWPLHVSPKEIGRIKLRQPNPTTKDFFIIEDELSEDHGIYGLGWEMYENALFAQGGTPTRAYLVEGEMDAMSFMAQGVIRSNIKYPVLSVGGSGGGAQLEGILESSGIQEAYLIGDSPVKGGTAGGDKVVEGWLNYIYSLHTYVYTGWDALQPAGDFDEAINIPSLGYEKIEESLSTLTHATSPWNWVYERAVVELDTVAEDDRRKLVETAKTFGACLKNKYDRDAYADELAARYPGKINSTILKRELASQIDDEPGYVMRCEESLREMFSVIGVKNTDNGTNKILVTYDSNRGEYHNICLDDVSSIAQQLAQIGGSLFDFATHNVGIPAFITSEKGGDKLRNIDNKLRFYFREAITNMAKNIPTINPESLPRQGYHHLASDREYIVCGPDVFKITQTPSGPVYEKLLVPRDGTTIFDVGYNGQSPDPWFNGRRLTLEDLEFGKTVDLKELHKDLLEFYDTGFFLKNHPATIQLLPLIAMSFPITDCFERPLMLFVTGESNSGKTSLISTLFNGGYRDLTLLWCSHGSDNASEASVAEMCNWDTRAMLFDEFETGEDNQRGRRTQGILESTRGVVGGMATRTRIGPEGKAVNKRLRMPIVFAAINTTEKPQDYNRMLVIDTQKVEGRDQSAICLQRAGFDQKRIYDIAYRLNTAMYAHTEYLADTYNKIRYELSVFSGTLPTKAKLEARYISSFVGMFAVAELIGIDWRTLFANFVLANQDNIERSTKVSESEMYVSAMLTNPVIQDSQNKIDYSIAMMLANPNKRVEINQLFKGAFYDETTGCVLFHLEVAIDKLLPAHYKTSRHFNGSVLKTIIDRHRDAIPASEILSKGILGRAQDKLGNGVHIHDVCVIHSSEWVPQLKKAAAAVVVEKPAEPVVVVASPKPEPEKVEEAEDDGMKKATEHCSDL